MSNLPPDDYDEKRDEHLRQQALILLGGILVISLLCIAALFIRRALA